MIYCSLCGGLGNQLFQIFTTISYSIDNNTKFSFPNKQYLGGQFYNRETYWNSFLKNLICYTINYEPKYYIFRENGFHYNKLPVLINDKNISLHGYYQSYKYFVNNYEEICDLLHINEIKNSISNLHSYDFNNSVSIHLRIGDYKYLQDYHPLLNYTYYYNSLLYIKNMTNITNILYFCHKDDNKIVGELINNLILKFPEFNFIKVDDNIDDWKQLLLMSLCQHNIIANSTFSWWGAYFNNNENKIVCYPDKWFGKKLSHNILKDLFPEKWIQIPTVPL